MKAAGILFISVLAIHSACMSVPAQTCDGQWQHGDGFPGIAGALGNTRVLAILPWDPDGPGPETLKIVVAGKFTTAGSIFASNIAAYDPETATWSALGTGITGSGSEVRGLAAAPDGSLIVVGDFTGAGGQTASDVASWNGTQWTPIGAIPFGSVHTVLVTPSGEIIIGGVFNDPWTNVEHVARWDGSTWVGYGAVPNEVYALALLDNGDLVIGGKFTNWGGSQGDYIARWDGAAWHPLGAGFNNYVRSLTVLGNGDLIAAGDFSSTGAMAVMLALMVPGVGLVVLKPHWMRWTWPTSMVPLMSPLT